MNVNRNNQDIADDHDVRMMVGHFYTRVREDAVLGPIFNEVSKIDWVDHIPTMCDFWETVLFQRASYKGNPIDAHVQLDQGMSVDHESGLQAKDFERWLEMFHETVDALYSGPRAELAKRSSSRMAQQLMDEVRRFRSVTNDDYEVRGGR